MKTARGGGALQRRRAGKAGHSGTQQKGSERQQQQGAKKGKAYSTCGSRMVTHSGTKHAQLRLTALSGREAVFSQ